MIKDIAWKLFKTTGDVNAFLELKQIEDIQKNQMQSNFQKVDTNGNNKNKGSNNCGK